MKSRFECEAPIRFPLKKIGLPIFAEIGKRRQQGLCAT
jgi:hypothetical protein